MSGIATLTSQFVDKVKGAGITILDTRKTTPLLRDLEKYAVRCGGGQNHRRDLESMVLVKENHIRSLGGTGVLVEFLEAGGDSGKFVEVEIDSLAFLKDILGVPVGRVMFDNFKPHQVRKGLKIIDDFKQNRPGTKLEVEVSGGISLKNISNYAIPGVDFISVGALTHSAPAITMSLEVL
jgi:nicotinate-nucleotide pyrophosphorylase (carboxylating)